MLEAFISPITIAVHGVPSNAVSVGGQARDRLDDGGKFSEF